ncbi:MAG: CdaR family protein [bacterium]
MADKWSLIRGLLLNNKRLKALSFVLATLTWYIIQDTISFEIEIPDVRLEIQVQDGMAILNQSASTVDVTFRGSQDDIQRLDSRRLQAVVELTGESGEMSHEIVMKPSMIKGVRGVRATAIHPQRIVVKLDRQAEKRVPVKGRTLGSPLFGQVESVTCEPSTVLLLGPAQKLKTTECVYTQPVEVDGRVESFIRRTAVQAPGDNWVAHMEPADVQVKVTIAGKSAGQLWKNIPVSAVVESGSSLVVDLDPLSVDVIATGRIDTSAAGEKFQVRAFADCIGLTLPGVYTVPVHVNVTGDAMAVARPDVVKVTVRLAGDKKL